MRRFLVGLLATLGALSLLAVAGLAIAIWLLLPSGAPELPERIVLTLDLREGLPEAGDVTPLAALGLERRLSVGEALVALERAARDPRVEGIAARLDGQGPGYAQAQELRAAVGGLREAGKFTLAYADSFGEFGPGTRGYYLATAFEEIHLQPLGAIGLTGLMLETPLLRGLLEQIGVEPAIDKRGRYKNAADVFTERALTPAHREALEGVADSVFEQLVAGIAAGRGLEEGVVRELIDGGPHGAEESLEVGLVDRLSYWDEVVDEAERRAGSDGRRIGLATYLDGLEPAGDDATVVAMVHGIGQIQRGDSEAGPTGSWIMGGDTVARALAAAADDPEVEVIVFRVDSPGGSAVASETIAREVRRAGEAGKPVIVSMADVAASGGYWIAMDAQHIVARPATLTGSIGVLAGKPVIDELWQQVGVNWGRVARGANADMWSLGLDYGPQGRARLEAFLDRTYDAFVAGVARGRGLPEDEVREAAEGRVWTGAQAQELGLIDGLGGFVQALALAREEAGVGADHPLELRRFPPPRTPFERAVEFLQEPWIGEPWLVRRLRAWLPDVLSAQPLSLR